MMTEQAALVICIAMWDWLAENPDATKLDAINDLQLPPMLCQCAACEYDGQFRGDCSKCPVWEDNTEIGEVAAPCASEDSPYTAWYNSYGDSLERVKAAKAVANMARQKLFELEKRG